MKFLKLSSIILTSTFVLAGCVTPIKQQHEAIIGQWRIVEIENSVIDNDKAVLTFSNEGSVSGNSGCNNLNGHFKPVHDHLNLTKLATTKKLCEPAANSDEQKFHLALPQIEHFLVKQDRLLLTNEQDETVITLIR